MRGRVLGAALTALSLAACASTAPLGPVEPTRHDAPRPEPRAPAYRARCDEVAAKGYSELTLS